jgi:hypothetical protein
MQQSQRAGILAVAVALGARGKAANDGARPDDNTTSGNQLTAGVSRSRAASVRCLRTPTTESGGAGGLA